MLLQQLLQQHRDSAVPWVVFRRVADAAAAAAATATRRYHGFYSAELPIADEDVVAMER